MAFLQQIAASIRQRCASSSVAGVQQSALPALFVIQRYMSGSKLFIGGLAWDTDEQTLREAFESFGEVEEAKIVLDRATGRSRGFGFVGFTSSEAAQAAMQQMDGRELAGRPIRVDFATQREPGQRGGRGGGYGGRGGRGGFRNGGGGGGYGGGFGGERSNGGSYGGGGYGGSY